MRASIGRSWTALNSGTTQNLLALSCPISTTLITATVCYAAGSGGTVRELTATVPTTATVDQVWATPPLTTTTGKSLKGIACTDVNHCYAVGDNETIVATSDGGQSWSKQFSSTGSIGLRAIACTSAACLAVGTSGTILTTQDGGSTWVTQTTTLTVNLNGVACSFAHTCTAVGDGGALAHTVNVTTWTVLSSPTTSGLNAVSCATSTCYAVGAGAIISSTNNGGAWTGPQASPQGATLVGVSCPTGATCAAVGSGGLIVSTADSGGSWVSEHSLTATNLKGVACPGTTYCFTVGNGGLIRTDGPVYVWRWGAALWLGGFPFRFAGPNISWLGEYSDKTFPSHFEIDDALETAVEMGATVVRSHSLGISSTCPLGSGGCVGASGDYNPNAIYQGPGTYNTAEFTATDYAIQRAGELGLHLIIPLTDNYRYYHGGRFNFTDWRGITSESCDLTCGNGDQFYTNSTVIGDFEGYVNYLLTHQNIYSSIANNQNPAIMAWEDGNELDTYPKGNQSELTTWVITLTADLTSTAPQQLVAEGYNGKTQYPARLSAAGIDLYTRHYYPGAGQSYAPSAADAAATAITVTQTYTKVFYVGEFDWSAGITDTDLTTFLAGFEPITSGVSGDLFWNLFAHADQHGWLTRGDRYNLYYPYDPGSDMAVRDQILRTHAFTMSNALPMPADGIPQAPQITAVVTVTIGGSTYYGVYWRGAEPAQTYVLSRSVMGPPSWQTICTTCTDSLDQSAPFTDSIPPSPPMPPATAYYENGGLNRASVAGPLSPIYTAP